MKRWLLVPAMVSLVALLCSCSQISPDQYAQAQSQIKGLQSDLSAAQSQAKAQQTDLDVARAQVKTQQIDLDSAQTQIKTLQTNLDTAQSQIKTLQTTLDTTQSQIKTLQTTVDTLQSQVKTPPTSASLTQFQSVQSQLQATTGKLAQIKQEMILFNYVWYPTIQGRTLDSNVINQWRPQVEAVGDPGLTSRFNTLVFNHDNASAVDFLTYIIASVASVAGS